MKLKFNVPVLQSNFGQWLDLRKRMPKDADCVMVLVNNGGGINAGHPQPVGYIHLPHQIYVKDIEKLVADYIKQSPTSTAPTWVTIVPIRSKEYIDIIGPKD